MERSLRSIYYECLEFDPPSSLFKTDKCNLIEGKEYQLIGTSCEGFEMKPRTFKFIKYIHSHGEVIIDGVIMKQIDGETGMLFSLSKNDCTIYNIPYESNLQIFPLTMKWKIKNKRTKSDKKKPESSYYIQNKTNEIIRHDMEFKKAKKIFDNITWETHKTWDELIDRNKLDK